MTLLRDLSESDFAARYECDRFTATVLASRMRYSIEHMCTRLRAAAFSPVLRDLSDYCATISGPAETGWAMAGVSQTVPLFYGPVPDGVKAAIEEYGPQRLTPGDVLIVNDPYRVGTHVNDVSFMQPIFADERIVGIVNITAHQLDWGGSVPGGFEITKSSQYEDGLILGPMLLYRDGEEVHETFALIGDNTRFPAVVLPDIRTIVQALDLGVGLISESVERYGVGAFIGSVRYSCDVSAESMALALENLPDGDYAAEEFIDGNGLVGSPQYRVAVTMRKRGNHAEFDFSGTSVAAPTAVNCAWPDVKTGVAMAVKFLLDPITPFTSGVMRNIDIAVPEGTLLNPQAPTCVMFYWQPVNAVMSALFNALNPVLGEHGIAFDSWAFMMHTAHGKTPDGGDWFSPATAAARPTNPWGASAEGDADTNQAQLYLNIIEMGLEQAEAGSPVVILQREALTDTAGPGFHRGGAAGIAESLWLAEGDHHISCEHVRGAPPGVAGGKSGTLGGAWLFPPADGDVRVLPPTLSGAYYKDAIPLGGLLDATTHELDPSGTYYSSSSGKTLAARSVLRFIGNGAGGWGDPFTRDPERVLRDVRDEYVSVDAARRDYGVVVVGDPLIDPAGVTIDEQATQELRERRG
jgi:N-methylhydantoinase B